MNHEDAPYGSMQNEDYAYDTWRQRKDEEMDAERNLKFIEDTRLEARDAIRAIIYARDLAPDAMIPTPLMLAIESARKVVA